MKNYELTYLISSELSEEKAKQLSGEITSLIQEKEGVLVEEKLPFKKKLAYAVKKQSQAYLTVANFQMLPEKLIDLEKELKTKFSFMKTKVEEEDKSSSPTRMATKGEEEDLSSSPSKNQILRYLILVKTPVKKVKITRLLKKTKIDKPEKEKKVELEEIEKKLEEILSDEG